MSQHKLTVPDSLEEVTLGQYQQYLASVDGLDETEYAEVINKKLIEAFCGIEYELVDSIPIKDIENVLEVLKIAFEKDYELQRHFKLLNVEMGFIPKLDEISLGEYIDCENYIIDWQNMHKAMAVLYRTVNYKQKERYTISPYEPSDQVSELMKEMPLSVVMGALVFFYRLGTELSAHTLTYTHQMLKEKSHTTSELRTALEKSGVGISQFMHSLKEMSEDLMRSHPSNYINALRSSHLKSKKTS